MWPEHHESFVICCRSGAPVFVFTQTNMRNTNTEAMQTNQTVESIFVKAHSAQFIHKPEFLHIISCLFCTFSMLQIKS